MAPNPLPASAKPSVESDLFVKNACIQALVNLLAVISCCILYFNYILLQPYLYVFVWAILLSVPLHTLKNVLIDIIIQQNEDLSSIGYYQVISCLVRGLFNVSFDFMSFFGLTKMSR